MLLEFELADRPGEVLPVLEMIDRFRFNISYISSQENGGRTSISAWGCWWRMKRP